MAGVKTVSQIACSCLLLSARRRSGSRRRSNRLQLEMPRKRDSRERLSSGDVTTEAILESAGTARDARLETSETARNRATMWRHFQCWGSACDEKRCLLGSACPGPHQSCAFPFVKCRVNTAVLEETDTAATDMLGFGHCLARASLRDRTFSMCGARANGHQRDGPGRSSPPS